MDKRTLVFRHGYRKNISLRRLGGAAENARNSLDSGNVRLPDRET